MPIYEYACRSCGERLEVAQSFSDESLTTCPVCGGPLRKVFGSISIAFKGNGFYRTDSRPAAAKAERAERDGKDGKADKDKKGDKAATGDKAKSETTPAKADAASSSSGGSSGSSSSSGSTKSSDGSRSSGGTDPAKAKSR